MKKKSLILTLVLGTFSFICQAQDGTPRVWVSEKIECGPGPEDMVLDTTEGRERILISCCGRREEHKPYGEIESLDLKSGDRIILERKDEPDGLLFRPHGIYLDGKRLYVISHEREPDLHPILIYRLKNESLIFEELINHPLLISPNALVTGEKGEIYFVNDAGKRGSLMEKVFKLKRANIIKLQKTVSGTWAAETVAEKLGYPAGVNRIGNMLFAGDAILNNIHIYEITTTGLTESGKIEKLKGNDNLRIHENMILTSAHVKPMKFMSHAKKSGRWSPVEVFLADPATGEINSLFRTNGSLISGGSTALLYGDHLYICQVFDPFILKVELF